MKTLTEDLRAAASIQIRNITSATLGKPSWTAGVHIAAFASEFDSSGVTAEMLEHEIELRKAHFNVDGHNWSDSFTAYNENFIEFCLILKSREVI